MKPLEGISSNIAEAPASVKNSGAGGRDFFETLKSLCIQVDREIQDADQKAEELAVGKRQDLHDVMIATEKADLSFRFLVQVRNKLLDAYNEIMRMQF